MTCEPADRQDGGGRGRGTRGREARSPFVTPGERQRPAPGVGAGWQVGGRGGQKVQPGRESPAGADQGCTGGLGSQDPPIPPPQAVPAGPASALAPPVPLSSSRRAAASPKVVLKTQRLGKKGKLATGPARAGRGGVGGGGEGRGEQQNIGALFPFPGRDMINRFLLI